MPVVTTASELHLPVPPCGHLSCPCVSLAVKWAEGQVASFRSLCVTAPRPCASLGKAVDCGPGLLFLLLIDFSGLTREAQRGHGGRADVRAPAPATPVRVSQPFPGAFATRGSQRGRILWPKAHTAFVFTSLSLMSLCGPRTPPRRLWH